VRRKKDHIMVSMLALIVLNDINRMWFLVVLVVEEEEKKQQD